MNWKLLRHIPWVDTRSRFLSRVPSAGSLLDVGSSDGETLNHFHEMRPDLKFYATDIEGIPEAYPKGCQFHQGDLNKENLPWGPNSLDAISCMHLVEHLEDLTLLIAEAFRLLKPGGRFYLETPHPKTLGLSSVTGPAVGTFTMNFWDDLTHTHIVSMGALAKQCRSAGFDISHSGTSRNWLFAAAYPIFFFAKPSRQKFTSKVHWSGWSAYLVARKP
ncbi:MAG: class I SAM-dependent methyltransferase [Limisphaerales bacterium]|nr:MAG: class I SAM-dependent methyltransferase [Limisphaerales bacterium]